MKSNDAKKSLKELETAAEAGDSASLQALAMLHELGLVGEASVAVAVQCYTKAVRAGAPEAAISLAHLQSTHSSQNSQRQKVIDGLYQFAAAKGYRSAAVRIKETFAVASKGTILLVDPLDASRLKTKALFEAAGLEVRDFFDPYKALRLVENSEAIDLVVSDVQMKELGGVEMLQIIRQRYLRTDLPVILISQSSSVEDLKRAKTYGVQGWFIKPFDAPAFLQSVRKLIQTSKKSRAEASARKAS